MEPHVSLQDDPCTEESDSTSSEEERSNRESNIEEEPNNGESNDEDNVTQIRSTRVKRRLNYYGVWLNSVEDTKEPNTFEEAANSS